MKQKRAKKQTKLRDMETPSVLGYELDRATLTPARHVIDVSAPGDYGADPLGDGRHRMVPSGDVVSYEERCRRLALCPPPTRLPAYKAEGDRRTT